MSRKKLILIVVFGFCLIVALAAVLIFVPKKRTPVIIYAEQISSEESNFRSWPRMKIVLKEENASGRTLAEVGSVGEYPTKFLLSPDRRTLVINLQSKIKLLDIASGKLTDIFTPKEEVSDVVYSPDSKQLFIWDQKYLQDGLTYYVHRLSIVDGKDEILATGESQNPFGAYAWREDDKVLVSELVGRDGYPGIGFFDLNEKKILTPKEPGIGYAVSPDGKLMAAILDSTEDPCDAIGLGSIDGYKIIDPVSGEVKGKVIDPESRLEIVAFSPDGGEVLYRSEKIPASEQECQNKQPSIFHIQKLTSGSSTLIEDIFPLLEKWNNGFIGAEVIADYQTGPRPKFSIDFRGEVWAQSNLPLELIGQYYR